MKKLSSYDQMKRKSKQLADRYKKAYTNIRIAENEYANNELSIIRSEISYKGCSFTQLWDAERQKKLESYKAMFRAGVYWERQRRKRK